MQQIKIGVVEDEIVIADGICHTLLQLGYLVAGPVISYTGAMEMMEQDKPDMLLLDIQLAGSADGIELAADVQKQYNVPYIFLTANSDAATVARAKAVHPYAFLVKPFTANELFAAIEVAMANYAARKANTIADTLTERELFVFIKHENAYHKILHKNIVYVQSVENYVVIVTADKRRYIVRTTFQQFLTQFAPDRLYRLHRSYAVNPAYIDTITATEVIVQDTTIPMHKAEQENVMKLVK